MSTAEIIAQLPQLTAAELAEVQAKLSELVGTPRKSSGPKATDVQTARIRSPHLAHCDQSRDFIKQIVELAPDAKI